MAGLTRLCESVENLSPFSVALLNHCVLRANLHAFQQLLQPQDARSSRVRSSRVNRQAYVDFFHSLDQSYYPELVIGCLTFWQDQPDTRLALAIATQEEYLEGELL